MNISYNWLKEYVDHDLTPAELADKLTMAGLEVEGMERIGASMEGVVVGEVLEREKHPNADRLTLCQVNIGADEPVQIVCGAPNVAAGQKVPVATVGTTLMLKSRTNPDEREPVKIKKSKLRGEVSRGMICAEDELGLSDDHDGIMVLREDAEIGLPFAAYLQAQGVETDDVVIDIAITPNRPDAISHLGVARDVAALEDLLVMRPNVSLPDAGGVAAEQIDIEIAAPELCPRYVAMVVRGVQIKESPTWLKQRLTAIGLRPRNNVVDIGNYVMHACGQPLHAFDYDEIAGQKIIVRASTSGEKFTTLDSKEYTLDEGTLLICDAEKPVALAGMMGGENSEVTDATTNVLIESAYFDPSTIRRGAKTLSISTDASYRFERGVDAEGQVYAAAWMAQLITEIAGGEIVGGMVDAHPLPPERREVTLRVSRIGKVLGIDIAAAEARQILGALGFEVQEETPLDAVADQLMTTGRATDIGIEEDVLRCTVPTFRPDVEREIDLIEEVARIYGFDRIPEPLRSALPNRTPRELPADQLRRSTRALIGGLGYRETYNNSLLPHATAERFNLPTLGGAAGDGAVVETLNAISQEMTTLRPSLLPGVLGAMAFNQNHGQTVLRFYEFGHVFHRATDDNGGVISGYAEHEAFIMAAAGPDVQLGWDQQPRTVDFFDLKGSVESLLSALRIPDVTMIASYEGNAVTAHHLAVASGTTPLGIIARIADETMAAYDLREPVYFAELDWSTIVALAAPYLQRSYAAVSRFPVVDRDIALVVARDEQIGPMLHAIREAGRPLLRHVGVFDLYEGEHIDTGKKSAAFSLRFGTDRTLKDAEVEERVSAILKRLSADFGAALRQ